MRKNFFDVFGMIILSITMLFWGCDPTEIENDPDLYDPNKEAPTVFLKKATDITLISAKISAGLKSGGLRTEAWFEYKAKGDDTYASTKVISFTEDSINMSFNLPGLKKDTQYFFKVVAKNKKGTSEKESVFNTIVEIVTDYDGNKYNAVRIGDQVWLQSNLRTTRFANGDRIKVINNVQNICNYAWNSNFSQAVTFKPGSPEYGGYYNGYFWNETRELISGYKLPSKKDYLELINFIGLNESTADKMIAGNDDERLRYSGIGDETIINSSGFSALGAGYYFSSDYSSFVSNCKFIYYNDKNQTYPLDYFWVAEEPYSVNEYITNAFVFKIYVYSYLYLDFDDSAEIQNGASIRLLKK